MTAPAVVDDFTDREAGLLVECERTIERGLKTFVEVGTALATIRDQRLYRTEYETFEAYLDQRWSISRSYAHRLIDAATVALPIGNAGLPMPANEGQARELARVPEEQRAEVWTEARERSNGRPTAAVIRDVVKERAAPPTQDVPAAESHSSDTQRPDAPTTPVRGLDEVGGGSPVHDPRTGEPQRERPPKWDPEERRRHEEEVLRIKDIEAAQQQAKTLVPDVRALIFTVLQGSRQDKDALRGLITRDMIADLRKAVDLLEGEIDDEE